MGLKGVNNLFPRQIEIVYFYVGTNSMLSLSNPEKHSKPRFLNRFCDTPIKQTYKGKQYRSLMLSKKEITQNNFFLISTYLRVHQHNDEHRALVIKIRLSTNLPMNNFGIFIHHIMI